MATGKEQFAALLDSQDFQMITSFKQTYIDALKHYYFVGGMPEAVQSFAENKDFNEVRDIPVSDTHLDRSGVHLLERVEQQLYHGLPRWFPGICACAYVGPCRQK